MNRIFPTTAPYLEQQGERELVNLPSESILLIGESETCETSLLFQSGVSFAAEGLQVTLVTQEPWMKLPKTVHGMPHPDPSVMKNLKILYMPTLVELISYLASIHQMAALPQVLIVENLHKYISQVNDFEKTAAKICALLVDTIQYLSSKCESSNSVHLFASTVEKNMGHVSVYRRFFQQVFQIHRTKTKKTSVASEAYEIRQLPEKAAFKAKTLSGFRFYVKDAVFLDEVLQT